MFLQKSENILKRFVSIKGINRIAQSPLVLKYTELFHHYTYSRRYLRMAQAIQRYRMCENKKSFSQINHEINICKKYWGCYPLHYFRYDLYRNDKKLSEKELLEYIPEFFFYYLFLPFYNSTKIENFLFDKNMMEQMFRKLSIAHPVTLGKLVHGQIVSEEIKQIGYDRIQKQLQENNYAKVFVKPADGTGGYGIFIFSLKDGNEYVTRDGLIFNEDFLKRIAKKNDYIIQPGLMQDHEISQIYPDSINTLRIATENIDGHVRILCTTLRMGRGGKEVDNSTQEGLIAKVDLDTGVLGDVATSENVESFARHPDTNFIFKNYTIPCWNNIKEFTIESARKIPQFRYLGWDIALIKNMPIALEANLKFSLDHYQLALGGLKETFRITNPEFYWKNKGKRI